MANSPGRKVVYKKNPVTGQMERSEALDDAPALSTPMGIASDGGTPQQGAMASQTSGSLGDAAQAQPAGGTNQAQYGASGSSSTPASTLATPSASPATGSPTSPQAPQPSTNLLDQLRYGGKAGQAAADAPQLSNKAVKFGQRASSFSNTASGLGGLDNAQENAVGSVLAGTAGVDTSGVSGTTDVNYNESVDTSGLNTKMTSDELANLVTGQLKSQLSALGKTPVTEATLSSLGYSGDKLTSLQQLLGRSPIGIPADELRGALDDAAYQIKGQLETERAVSEDTSLGRNAREAAAGSAAELEQASAPQIKEIDKTLESMLDAGTVNFFGQQVTLDKVLGDPANAATVASYIKGDAATVEKMRRESPEIAKYLDDNAATMKAALEKRDADNAATLQTQTIVNSVIPQLEGAGVPKNVIDNFTKAVVTGNEIAKAFTSADFSDFLSKVSSLGESSVDSLLRGEYGNLDDLKAAGLFSADTATKMKGLQNLENLVKAVHGVEDVIKSRSPDEALAKLFPDGMTIEDIQAMLSSPDQFKGHVLLPMAQTLFDSNKDGKVDSKISLAALDQFQKQLKDAFKGGGAVVKDKGMGSLQDALHDPSFDKVRGAFGDGRITTDEAPAVSNAVLEANAKGVSTEDLEKRLKPLMNDPAGAAIVQRTLHKAARQDVDRFMGDFLSKTLGLPGGGSVQTILYPQGNLDSPETDQLIHMWGDNPGQAKDNLDAAIARLTAEIGNHPEGGTTRHELNQAIINLTKLSKKLDPNHLPITAGESIKTVSPQTWSTAVNTDFDSMAPVRVPGQGTAGFTPTA